MGGTRALHRKARPTAAGCGGVRVVDAEGGADDLVGEVDFSALEEVERHRIDKDDHAVFLDRQVVVFARLRDREIVLEAGAAAAVDCDPQHGARRLLRQNRSDAPCGAVGDGDGSGLGGGGERGH